jgi:hypothetical protein
MIELSPQICTDDGYKWRHGQWLSRSSNRSLSPSLLQRMASNDDGKRKMEEEAESSTARKRLRLSDNDGGDNDSSDSLEEETEEEEEVSLEEMSMNELDTSEEKLYDRRARGILSNSDGCLGRRYCAVL